MNILKGEEYMEGLPFLDFSWTFNFVKIGRHCNKPSYLGKFSCSQLWYLLFLADICLFLKNPAEETSQFYAFLPVLLQRFFVLIYLKLTCSFPSCDGEQFIFSIFQLPLMLMQTVTKLPFFKEKILLFLHHFIIGHILHTSNSSCPFLPDSLLVSSHLKTPLLSLPDDLRYCFILDFSYPKNYLCRVRSMHALLIRPWLSSQVQYI